VEEDGQTMKKREREREREREKERQRERERKRKRQAERERERRRERKREEVVDGTQRTCDRRQRCSQRCNSAPAGTVSSSPSDPRYKG
jgi:hypothetical protein